MKLVVLVAVPWAEVTGAVTNTALDQKVIVVPVAGTRAARTTLREPPIPKICWRCWDTLSENDVVEESIIMIK